MTKAVTANDAKDLHNIYGKSEAKTFYSMQHQKNKMSFYVSCTPVQGFRCADLQGGILM